MDAQNSQLLENTRRLSSGHAAHDVLLWGARGTGKSATVSSVIGKLQAEGQDIALVQFATDRLKTLPDLFTLLRQRSEEHTSELQSLMRISYAVFCLKTKNIITQNTYTFY